MAAACEHIEAVSAAEAKACRDIFDHGVGSEATQIYRGARNTVYRVDGADRPLCVKHFRFTKFPNCYIYTTLRHSKARRSYEHALRLSQLGFSTPAAVAWHEHRRGLRLDDSYYVCEYLDLPNMRGWIDRPDSAALTDALAAEMLRLHRAGVYNRDFSPGNLLVEELGDGRYRFYHVDINRINFDVHDRRKHMRMFRSISTDPLQTEALARSYARQAGLDEAEVVSEALHLLEQYKAEKRRHRALKRLIGKK